MNHAPHGAPARRSRRVACTECRQQKARCDAGPLPDQPCSRCRKFKLPCVVSNCFKRQHKHRKLSELEHEAEALRLELRGNEYDDAPTNDHHPQQAALGPAPSTSSIRANREFISTAGRCESPSRTADMFGHQSEHHHRSAVRTETSSTHEPGSRNAGPRSSSFPATRTTVAQSLAGVSLTGCEIDGLFSIYSDAQANAVAIIIRVFDTRVRDLEVEKLTRLAKELTQEITGFSTLTVTENLHVQSARLNILVFSLFIPSSGATDDMVEPIQLLLSTAKSVLDLVKRVVQLPTFPPSPPNHIVDTFLISTFTILRIAKIYPNNVWVADAESCINSCKLLARSLSSNDNDALFKTGMMLDDLWGNPRAYRKPDGSADAPIGYLGRLSAGLVMDAASKWHEIVDSTSMLGISGLTEGVLIGQQLPIQSSSAAFHDTTTEAMLSFGTGHNAPLSNGEGHYLSMFDDDIFGDFDWYGEMPYA
ncbi:hypothetical protein D6D24_07451 [Aureobasidium pullulans]|uniref:Zn(2)-C6 fungal-type domain-containing protein n=1 Tax=Aureobasidium pullulans TaxID=5580 RepID=A0A4S8U1N8_AURPU|nr:hypothetical protein D6D26_09061 [Aureobasidium pullulans]THW11079.1 hypothetical protein D6D24_07451 [Aureobasidium pullulans]